MATLNEMLLEAITTDSRKRKARYQIELEALGYKIIKDGGWIIRNNTTNRRIRLDYGSEILYTTNGSIRFGRIWSYKQGHYVTKPLEKINLERLLNKNNIIETWNYRDNWTDVERMAEALHDRKRHQKELDNAWSEFQSNLDRITKEYNKKIADAKKSYEWNVEYHTNGLKSANSTIKRLLNKA